MTKYQKRHRIIATFFLLIFFPSLIPNNLFAANNGPVSPEATSFEPIDATDMVNLISGDMSYVLPLLNIPSPEGGYPLTLSNHAGIAMDQEASWVGLGWSLNPGAINRGVTGVPDDWKRAKVNQIVYDAGGVSSSYSGSLSIGWGSNGASVGLYGSYTENKSFGGVNTYNTSGGVQGSFAGVFAKAGSDGSSIGIGYAGISASIGTNGANISASDGSLYLGVNQSFKGQGTSAGASLGVGSGTEISFSSKNGLSGSVTGQGFQSSGNNYGNGGLNISASSFNIPIQIYAVNLTFGYSKTRYWTYQNRYTGYQGSLYAGDMEGFEEATNFNNINNSDSYNSLYLQNDENQANGDNLAFMAYDYYSVSGQGISGSFKPGIFENGSLQNNAKTVTSSDNSARTYTVGTNRKFTKTIDDNTNDIHFYFDNEPSSFLRITSNQWTYSPYLPTTPPQNFNDSSTFNTLSYDNGVVQNGYVEQTKRKRTGSYIETFTNKEILTSNNSIIVNPENYDRTSAPADGIGAFKITALDGKVYHYSLPVYQKDQFTRATTINSDFNSRFFEKQQFTPYATHWLLTAITGPDYIDTNLNNKVDQEDMGYWTSFDYGKWSDGFTWCTPVKNDGTNKSYSWGVKEIYYLDKIKTRTHTALFIKEERSDDLSYSLQIGNNENDLDLKNARQRNLIVGKNGKKYYDGIYESSIQPSSPPAYWVMDVHWGQYIKSNTHKSLRLSKILLLKNENVNLTKSKGIHNPSTFKGQIKFVDFYHEVYWQSPATYNDQTVLGRNQIWYGEYYNNVYDKQDIIGQGLEQKAIKTILFGYDTGINSLAKNAPNLQYSNEGRLTLNSVQFLSRDNNKIIPPYKFGYINTENYDATKEDNWGYYKDNPSMWSLNKIVTPLGSEINITYESDDFDKEAVSSPTTVLSTNDKNSGGTRVKEVCVKENSVIKNIIRYFYNVPGFAENKTDTNYKSSGITSYMPSKSFKEVKYLSELPSPGVLYEYVTVKNYSSNNELGTTQEYNFNVLKQDIATISTSLNIPGILEIEKTQNSPWSGSANGESYNLNFSRFNIKDITSSLGRLKHVKTFNSLGQLLSKTQNTYQDISNIKQGISEETFSVYKRINDGSVVTYRLGSTSKIKYPNILKSTTSTQGSYTTSNYIDKLDFLTGQVVESHSVTSDGKSFKQKIIPAYLKYQEMGSKADGINNKNMLSQTAANYSYLWDTNDSKWKETGVGITTWSNIWKYNDITGTSTTPSAANEKIWRQHKSYVWNGVKDNDGIFQNYNNVNSDDGFVWEIGSPQVNTKWKQISEITLYDHFSAALEMKDINGNYASSKKGDNDTKIIATGNAGYNEMFYTGAENTPSLNYPNFLEPKVVMLNASRNATIYHTGKYSVAATSSSQFGVTMNDFDHKPGKYKISVWVEKANAAKARINNNGSIIDFSETYNAGNWVLKAGYVNVASATHSIYVTSLDASTVYFDDLMIRPIASSITGYVYNEWDELTHIIGNNGLATQFEYDTAGRLIRTYSEIVDDVPNGITGGFKLAKSHTYNNKFLNR
ncbi:hypothetical protein [Flavobacterium hydatis]|uniref:Sugar-binding protein n=1 Tax=Flavobacterium hydatis TaxID=991 RepID=A0A086A5N7_FLAHY|nr:hypothetical protein [Flavobacterium hydatis]KFF12001.1 hypothetical protein IW20_18765 [Flavobacterium hydatis]OXA94247.1 hypothetical protein B0A62_11360 [Flavobacterium hydatis]